MVKLKKFILIKGLFLIILWSFFFHGCSVGNEKIIYDRDIKTFKFDIPSKKIAIGLLYFTDSRSDFDRLGEDLFSQKKSIRQYATKLAQDILNKYGSFSSVSIIAPYELPNFSNSEELEKFLKNHDIDYIIAGEILEAKVVKEEEKEEVSKKVKNIISYGITGDNFIYVGRARVKGKLFSIVEKKVVWEGEGRSYFKPSSKYATIDINLSAALHNAIGSMLRDMTSVFTLKIKEVQ